MYVIYEEDFLYGPRVLFRAFSLEFTRSSNLFSILLFLYSIPSICYYSLFFLCIFPYSFSNIIMRPSTMKFKCMLFEFLSAIKKLITRLALKQFFIIGSSMNKCFMFCKFFAIDKHHSTHRT